MLEEEDIDCGVDDMKTRDCSFRGDGGREGRTRVQTSNVGVYSADGARLWRTVGGPTRQD